MRVVWGALYDGIELPLQHPRGNALRIGEPLPIKPAEFRQTPSGPVYSFFAESRRLGSELAIQAILLGARKILIHRGTLWIGAHPFRREPVKEIVDIRFGSRQKLRSQKEQRKQER